MPWKIFFLKKFQEVLRSWTARISSGDYFEKIQPFGRNLHRAAVFYAACGRFEQSLTSFTPKILKECLALFSNKPKMKLKKGLALKNKPEKCLQNHTFLKKCLKLNENQCWISLVSLGGLTTTRKLQNCRWGNTHPTWGRQLLLRDINVELDPQRPGSCIW